MSIEMQGRCFLVYLLACYPWVLVSSSVNPGFLDVWGKTPVPGLQKSPFPPSSASKGSQGTAVASTQQIRLIQINHKPFRQPFLLPSKQKEML